MRERPIIFNADMVRAVLSGSKTQTRRIINPQPFDRSWSRHDHQIEIATGRAEFGDELDGLLAYTKSSGGIWHAKCPFGQPGDRLWVRETFALYGNSDQYAIHYRANHPEHVGRKDMGYRPSIHMPHWASRITLEITGVRVERLQDISEADSAAEGVSWKSATPGTTAKDDFSLLWKSIYGEESWQANPWVWVIEFKRVEGEQ